MSNDTLMEFDHILSNQVYDKVFSELSNKEQQILLSFDKQDEMLISDIMTKTDLNAKEMSVYRSRLINKGVIISS